MRILWIVNGLLPVTCDALGFERRNSSGWLESMLDELRKASPDNTYSVLSLDSRPVDISIDNVRYMTFSSRFNYKRTPPEIEAEIKRKIINFNPDIIHIHGTEYFYGCMNQAVYCGKPVVVSIQGVLSGIWPMVTGNLTWHDVWRAQLNLRFFLKGQTLFKDRDYWRRVRVAQEAMTFRRQHYFVGRTEWDRAWVKYYNPEAKYFSVNENLRPPFFAVKRDLTKVRKHTIFCAASAGAALKGCHWIMRAVMSLKKEYPDIELRIAAADEVFARPKNLRAWLMRQTYHAYLRELARKLDLRENIVALPNLSAEQMAEELCRAELYVLPSMCENSPNSLCEAMLVGTPAIATFVGGVSSILKDGVEGKLVSSSDPAALAGAIREWFEHPEQANDCAVEARRTALKRHNAQRNAEQMLAVYSEILKKQ